MPKLTDREAAYCAMAWYKGKTQLELAERLGYKSSVPISLGICAWLGAYTGKDPHAVWGKDRKLLVPDAMDRYMDQHGLRIIPAAPQRRKRAA